MPDNGADLWLEDMFGPDEAPMPAQLAMHGLLSVLYDAAAGRHCDNAERVLALIAHDSRGVQRWIPVPANRWFISMAAAACVALGAWLLWTYTSSGPAKAFDLREIGFAPPLLATGPTIGPDDAELTARKVDEIARNQVLLSQSLAGELPGIDPWRPWTQIIRNLRALGRWEQAIEETATFLQYAHARESTPNRYTGYGMALGDLADIYTAMGDYETATDYRRQAMEYARDYHGRWSFEAGRYEGASPHDVAGSIANSLVPQLWFMSMLAAAQQDQQTAWDYLIEAEDLLLDYFDPTGASKPSRARNPSRDRLPFMRSVKGEGAVEDNQEATERGSVPRLPALYAQRQGTRSGPPKAHDDTAEPIGNRQPVLDAERGQGSTTGPRRQGASRIDNLATLALAAHIDETAKSGTAQGVEPIVTKVREHLLMRARLHRIDRDLDAAEYCLALGRTIPAPPHAQELRLDFEEPFEELLIAVARGDFAAALEAAEEAHAHTGPIDLPEPYPDREPIGLLPRAELQFLKGVTLAGLDRSDPEPIRLMDSALARMQDLAATFAPRERKRFLKPSEDWERVRDDLD